MDQYDGSSQLFKRWVVQYSTMYNVQGVNNLPARPNIVGKEQKNMSSLRCTRKCMLIKLLFTHVLPGQGACS